MDRAVFPGLQGGPLMHVIAGKAVALGQALTPEFQRPPGGDRPQLPRARRGAPGGGVALVSGGTDNHLVLVDLSATAAHRRRRARSAWTRAGITVNKNGVPFDERPPTVTSGLRIGTPALTTRGLREEEMREIGQIIVAALRPRARPDDDLEALRARSRAIGDRFPLYPRLQAATPVS